MDLVQWIYEKWFKMTVLQLILTYRHIIYLPIKGQKKTDRNKNLEIYMHFFLFFFSRIACRRRKIPVGIGVRTVRWSSSQNFVDRRYYFVCACLFWGWRWINYCICRAFRHFTYFDCQCLCWCLAGEYTKIVQKIREIPFHKKKIAKNSWNHFSQKKSCICRALRHFSYFDCQCLCWCLAGEYTISYICPGDKYEPPP